jgi:signal transduction histidine kinase
MPIPLFANWRTLLTIVALVIVTGTIFYSRYLANKIAADERQIVEAWAEAHRFIAEADADDNIAFASVMISSQQTIPVIETNERDSITNFHNLDSADAQEPGYLRKKLREFAGRQPIVTYIGNDSTKFNKYYYGESRLLYEVRYYPFVQLFIVALFILVTLNALNARHRATQNQLWAGMAKETAHQLGTPLTSLQGWMEMLRETGTDASMLNEMERDVVRLKLVSDRFSKIGSTPHLEQRDLLEALRQVMEYMRKRAPEKVRFLLETGGLERLVIPLSYPLFDWVIENLLKNALDAMEGKGEILIRVLQHPSRVVVDVTDSGKGMTALQAKRVFNPGFTTKKRGWGLGLTLSKRIIEEYHGGQLQVHRSEPGKGTTFRVSLPVEPTA